VFTARYELDVTKNSLSFVFKGLIFPSDVSLNMFGCSRCKNTWITAVTLSMPNNKQKQKRFFVPFTVFFCWFVPSKQCSWHTNNDMLDTRIRTGFYDHCHSARHRSARAFTIFSCCKWNSNFLVFQRPFSLHFHMWLIPCRGCILQDSTIMVYFIQKPVSY
jgi:hypothetical protein